MPEDQPDETRTRVPCETSGEGELAQMSFVLKSPAFRNGGEIPSRYTCSGNDLSPPLLWGGAPANTRSFALIADDPDAPGGTFTHWLIWNLPARLSALPEAIPGKGALQNGICQGRNDFGRFGYGGPCPPPGRTHRYFFRLYALDAVLNLRGGAGRGELERAARSHVLARAEWMGTFRR